MVRLLKTYQCLITSVLLITLSSCTTPSVGQKDGSPENAVSDSTPVSSPETKSDQAVSPDDASTPTTQTIPQTGPTIEPNSAAVQGPPSSPQSLIEDELSSASSSERVTITIYRIDSFCRDFIPEPIRVDPDRAIEQAIAKVLELEDNSEFKLAGYRVKVDAASSVATVDLRLSPNSPRKIISLSNCEQLALFGSLRETLLGNPEWNIEDVQFTERGQDIIL
ncbi:MAG: hypothetical protein MJA27_10195 [Pseudanabaenales cyanobacterium]|nr:hypothetical protein [Pseudanabaenales cyanobacterium]